MCRKEKLVPGRTPLTGAVISWVHTGQNGDGYVTCSWLPTQGVWVAPNKSGNKLVDDKCRLVGLRRARAALGDLDCDVDLRTTGCGCGSWLMFFVTLYDLWAAYL